MDHRADGDVFERKRIADFDVACFAGNDGFADLKAVRSNDVTLFAVCIVQKSDVCGTVGIVFNGCNLCGDVVLVAFEVNNTILTLCAAAAMADGDPALVVATRVALEAFHKGTLGGRAGNLLVSGDGHEALTGSVGLNLSDCHCCSSLLSHVIEGFNGLGILRKGDVGLLGGGAAAFGAALPLNLAETVDGVDAFNLYAVKNGFNSLLDLGFACLLSNDEDVSLVLNGFVDLLGEYGLDDDVVSVHYAYTSSTFSTASLVRMSASYLRTS